MSIVPPKISIIVPIYNVEEYLHRCVDSILNQTFTAFELILVDDGSPDNCGAICDEYAKKDKRIKVIHKGNGGLSDARNAGIDIASGEYLGFVDSDDWIHPQMYEVLYKGIVENNVKISICEYEETERQREFEHISDISYNVQKGLDLLVSKNVTAVVAWNKLYHKSLFDKIRYPVGKIHEDEFVTYKLLYEAVKISYCENRLYFYFINENGITKSEYSPKHLDMLDAFEERVAFLYEKKENKCFRFSAYHMINMTELQYFEYKKSSKYKYVCKNVSKRMRRYLKQYGKCVGISKKSHYHFYVVAYPMKFFVKKTLSKLKNKVR